ncbi:MAG TPA: protein-disulfide reductase DsbD domain-containing protein [Terriglobales bacterium]|nr:protein-disulfide reductase DsbD domain-containing protein [Terriglobales bacterium]
MRLGTPSILLLRTLLVGVTLPFCAAGVRASGAAIPHGTVELIAENQWIAAGYSVNLGLHFRLEKGWHIYWINPGDSGEPPRVEWHLPAGFTADAIEWPAPRRLGTSSIVDFGYEDAVTLIVPIHAEAYLPAQQTAQLAAEVKVLVCREMCLPGKAHLSLALPIKSQPPAPETKIEELFSATRKSLPRPAPKNWRFSIAGANESFVLTVSLGRKITQAVFFPLVESQIDNAAPQKLLAADSGFRLTLRKSDQLLKPIEDLKGVLVLSGDQAYLIDVPVGKLGATVTDNDIGIRSAKFMEEGQ